MWGIVLFLCFVAASRQISITEFSVPNSTKSGEDVRLTCKYELTSGESDKALFVKWWWTPFTNDERKQLYQRIAGHPAVAIHNDIKIEENDAILLLNVTPEDSGTYECEVSNIDEARKHSDLIVYTMGSGPVLNISLVEDGPDEDDKEDVLVTCSALDVAPYPDLVIVLNGQTLNTSESVYLRSPPDGSTYNITSTGVVSKDQADGAEISCELYYKDVNVTHSPFIVTETYYVNQSELTTTEDAEDAFRTEDPSYRLNNTKLTFRVPYLLLLIEV
ncbi:unnamed protein product [Euphydryas editha]|uniref:Ig-like domain-containing protein n=1 Tax=Euphydryas editha TaxID=104508 RepID=A0AAU9V8X7_EUPED|nr:unnamed protein product [Euphydryas editha]